jgi:hypothetical protein
MRTRDCHSRASGSECGASQLVRELSNAAFTQLFAQRKELGLHIIAQQRGDVITSFGLCSARVRSRTTPPTYVVDVLIIE